MLYNSKAFLLMTSSYKDNFEECCNDNKIYIVVATYYYQRKYAPFVQNLVLLISKCFLACKKAVLRAVPPFRILSDSWLQARYKEMSKSSYFTDMYRNNIEHNIIFVGRSYRSLLVHPSNFVLLKCQFYA